MISARTHQFVRIRGVQLTNAETPAQTIRCCSWWRLLMASAAVDSLRTSRTDSPWMPLVQWSWCLMLRCWRQHNQTAYGTPSRPSSTGAHGTRCGWNALCSLSVFLARFAVRQCEDVDAATATAATTPHSTAVRCVSQNDPICRTPTV